MANLQRSQVPSGDHGDSVVVSEQQEVSDPNKTCSFDNQSLEIELWFEMGCKQIDDGKEGAYINLRDDEEEEEEAEDVNNWLIGSPRGEDHINLGCESEYQEEEEEEEEEEEGGEQFNEAVEEEEVEEGEGFNVEGGEGDEDAAIGDEVEDYIDGSDHDDDNVDGNQEEDEERALADELEDFRRHGLMMVRNPRYLSLDVGEGHYGLEATKKYPMFFRLIPQNPHYRGLLQDDIDEGTRRTVYLSLWYSLVHLMGKVLCTTCFTDHSQIQEMMDQAEGLEKLGFDVRHVMARLKQPMYRIRDLEIAREELKLVKRRKRFIEEQHKEIIMLEGGLNELKNRLWSFETILMDQERAEISSVEEHNRLKVMLREKVVIAKRNLRAKELEVASLGSV